MLIGVDIDGVLYPWDEAARDAVVKKFGIPRPPASTEWDTLKKALPGDAWAWLWTREGQDAAFGQTWRTYPGAVEAINAILKPGTHRVHFVTHRDPRYTGYWTAGFLSRQFGGHPWAGTHVVQASVAKRTLARWDVFIDDKPETVFDFLGNTGAQVFCPVRDWNHDELHPLTDTFYGKRFRHYTDPREIAEWVLR